MSLNVLLSTRFQTLNPHSVKKLKLPKNNHIDKSKTLEKTNGEIIKSAIFVIFYALYPSQHLMLYSLKLKLPPCNLF